MRLETSYLYTCPNLAQLMSCFEESDFCASSGNSNSRCETSHASANNANS